MFSLSEIPKVLSDITNLRYNLPLKLQVTIEREKRSKNLMGRGAILLSRYNVSFLHLERWHTLPARFSKR